jgi:DNA-binding NarL/FixJ family response regulator
MCLALPKGMRLLRFQLERLWREERQAVVNFVHRVVMSDRAVPPLTVSHRAESQPEVTVNHPKPAKRQRIPAPQRIRVMQLYASGRNQTAIAKQEKLNRETVGRIVHGSEMKRFR